MLKFTKKLINVRFFIVIHPEPYYYTYLYKHLPSIENRSYLSRVESIKNYLRTKCLINRVNMCLQGISCTSVYFPIQEVIFKLFTLLNLSKMSYCYRFVHANCKIFNNNVLILTSFFWLIYE